VLRQLLFSVRVIHELSDVFRVLPLSSTGTFQFCIEIENKFCWLKNGMMYWASKCHASVRLLSGAVLWEADMITTSTGSMQVSVLRQLVRIAENWQNLGIFFNFT